MIKRLEIALKPELKDAEGEALRKKGRNYLGLALEEVRVVQTLTFDTSLSAEQLEDVRGRIFTNPVTQVSAFQPLAGDFDWLIWVGFLPGVRDNAGATGREAIEALLGVRLPKGEALYTSKQYRIRAPRLKKDQADRIARELLANDLIQQWKIIHRSEWDPREGTPGYIPKVILKHEPSVSIIPIDSLAELLKINKERSWALPGGDLKVIQDYFNRPEVREARKKVGLDQPTDVELEYISQARSDHCNHNTFRGLFLYRDLSTGETVRVDNLFKTCIEAPTLKIQKEKDWVVSVLWDNAGVARFDADHNYVITAETHNSPSNMEPYGGALTGIVGVYRDPLGTGKGARIIMGSYGYCVGPRDYPGPLTPRLHPRRLLDGVIEGVKDGGNKSGIPTPFGQVFFHPAYLGKCLVFVAAVGFMPARIGAEPSEVKKTEPGDLIVMCGGRVGKDGIHGVTASSEVYSASTPAGHVQIGDPYTQKKMHDFLLEARDAGLIAYITDNGGGGLSSSVGESARSSKGCEVHLDRVPLKYEGLDQWEIWISESQERMTVGLKPENWDRFQALARKHDVESTVIGDYTASGKVHLLYRGRTCGYVDLEFLEADFPQWTFEAEWQPPEQRGFCEPVFQEPDDYGTLLQNILARPNIASKSWIARQYDHEVQGGSVLKPLTGRYRDVPGDAVVLRPHLPSLQGLAFTQALLPTYAAIDTYAMVAATIDEAVRRLVTVGGDLEQIGGVDNFCWPSVRYDPRENPDGKFKAAQLVRANWALREVCLHFGIPLLSGKDSMYVDGYIPGPFGERHRISGLPTFQFSATTIVADLERCVSPDLKFPGDLIYLLGETQDELGGSEYYELMGYLGLQVPRFQGNGELARYRALQAAIAAGLVSAAHGVYRGGLGVHLSLMALAGDLGLEVDLSRVPGAENLRPDKVLFSESCGRVILAVDPRKRKEFEKVMPGALCARIGQVLKGPRVVLKDQSRPLAEVRLKDLRAAFHRPFGGLV
ncbi:MAG: phosphoribosylformylglycinamidine synthase [Deltaproteobacteria bacterium]|nr:phosphoribosylformylglycinamidine synthase [Deltaproteobacteria bacterium]